MVELKICAISLAVDLNALSVFVKVVEAGSFVGAESKTGIAKSTIARRIDDLEKSLGVRLLQRNTRQSQLTEAGRDFYQRARQIVEDVDEAVASVNEWQENPRGKLRISTFGLFAEIYLASWVLEFMRSYPEVEVEMILGSERLDLISEEIDLAIRVGTPSSSRQIVRKLAVSPHYLCASPTFIAKYGPIESLADIHKLPCVLYAPNREKVNWRVMTQDGKEKRMSVSGPLRANSMAVVLQGCQEGVGTALIPSMLCCESLRSGKLIRLFPEWSDRNSYVHALYPSRHHLSTTVRTFLDFVQSKLSPVPWLTD